MIIPAPRPERRITRVRREKDILIMISEAGYHKIEPKTSRIIRIVYTDKKEFYEGKAPGVIFEGSFADWEYKETEEEILFITAETTIRINRASAAFSYYDKEGRLLLKERESESKELEVFDSYKTVHDDTVEVEKIETPDGIKQIIKDAKRVFDKKLYKTRLHLLFQKEEAIYGFGQKDDGILNLRGTKVYVHQANRKIAIPMLVSSLGYGILIDTYSPLIFSDNKAGAYIHTEADHAMDFYFINGGSMDGVVRGYRVLSGKAVMLPRWAYGYIQSQERYETQEEILAVAAGFRDRKFGLDCLVLDWCSWEGNLWGQKTFDSLRFPNPAKMTEELHKHHIRFMISIWPNMDEKSDNYKEFKENDLLIPGTTIYNPYKKEGREMYWKQVKEGLFDKGVDAWWCDSSEPITPEWAHIMRPEEDAAYYEYLEEGSKQLDMEHMNSYSFFHAMAIYEGQRGETDKKRIVNLTRSGYTGQQRFGTILWSGDTSASWDTFRKQIAAGLNLCASGLPYWTTDIGAFFVKKGLPWFWNGEYDSGNKHLGYRELYVRWFQFGCFLPIFRSHGTDTRREPWLFGEEGDPFYIALKKSNELRYRFLPYLYTCAYRVWKEDFTILRMLAFDYPGDKRAREMNNQFLFGDKLMVCPVTKPMYHDKDENPITVVKTHRVYLPDNPGGWYDFYTGKHLEGGREILAHADIDKIPLFVTAGTILPLSEPAASVDEMNNSTLTIRVYRGQDAKFELYDDSGDGYGYESGEYTLTGMSWNEETGKLTISDSENRQYFTEIIGE